MKYLKQFESVSESGKYYTKISTSYFENTMLDEYLDIKGPDEVLAFSEKEIEYLEKLDNEIGIQGYFLTNERRSFDDTAIEKEWRTTHPDCLKDIIQIGFSFNGPEEEIGFSIYKYKDEWFYVEAYGYSEARTTYYECDQLEGIQKLAMDLI